MSLVVLPLASPGACRSSARSATANGSCAGAAPTTATYAALHHPGINGCSATRSPPNGDITRFPMPRNSPATAASARASISPASVICAARSQSKARATCAGRSSRQQRTLHRTDRPGSLPANEDTHRKQRGAKIAQIEIARRLSEAISHMLIAAKHSLLKAPRPPGRLTVLKEMRRRSELHRPCPSDRGGDRDEHSPHERPQRPP